MNIQTTPLSEGFSRSPLSLGRVALLVRKENLAALWRRFQKTSQHTDGQFHANRNSESCESLILSILKPVSYLPNACKDAESTRKQQLRRLCIFFRMTSNNRSTETLNSFFFEAVSKILSSNEPHSLKYLLIDALSLFVLEKPVVQVNELIEEVLEPGSGLPTTEDKLKFHALLPSLLKLMQEASLVAALGLQPTLLTVTTLKLFLFLTSQLEVEPTDPRDPLFDLPKHLIQCCRVLERALYCVTIQALAEELGQISNAIQSLPPRESSLPALLKRLKWLVNYGQRAVVSRYLQEGPFDNLRKRRTALAQVSSLASSLAKPTDGGLIVSDVRNLCLLLGRLGHAQITAVLAQFGAQLIPVLSELIKLPQAEVQRPALALFQRLVIQEKGQAEAEIFLEPLFEMLAEEDSAAKAVVGLLAQFIAQYPHSRLLGKVFEQLDKPLINLRLNAMALLKELITVRQDQLPVSPLLQQEVAEKLLTRLTDEELASRVGAADLFVSLPPAFVLPRLVQLLHHTDARQRAAAGASLKAVLEKGEPSRVFSEFLNLLRSPPVIQEADDPSMLGEQNELRWPADYPSRLVQLLKEFLSHTSTASRSTLTAQLLEHFWAHPSSEPLVRTLGSVVALLDVRFILSEVASRLEQLRDDQDIFVQLAPLLVLKLVPVGDWERFDSELTSLERQLPTLLSNPRPELRQVAAECFGRLARPSVLVSQWTDVLATGPPSSVRAVLFSLCQRLLLQPLSLVAEFPLLLTSTLKLVASLEQSTAEDDVKLSRGLADHLGFLLRASLVQLDQQHKSSGSKLALKQLEEGLPVQLRDCGLDNLFAFALFNLSSSSPLLLTAWASCLKACDDSQLTLVSRLLLSKLPASPKESSPFLEVAFHLSFHLSSKNLLEQDTASLLVDVAQAGLKESELTVRFAALKLLGTSLSCLRSEDPRWPALRSTLKSLSNLDAHESVRRLAEQLFTALFKQQK